jgi:signal transduction histidine kinase
MFLFLSLAVGIFQICHVFGINVVDAEASRAIFTGSLSVIFIIAFTVHWILAVLEKDIEKWKTLLTFYIAGVGLTVFYLLYPDTFLLTSVPKMYLPNYYEAGQYYWLMFVYFTVGALYALYALIHAYRIADPAHKNRLRYFIVAIITGFPLGSTAFFLAMNIQIDPIYSTLFSFYIIPLAYGILRYDVMDIKVVAKKALYYAVLVSGVGLLVSGINIADTVLSSVYPWIPGWAIPLSSAILAVLIGGFVWEKMRDIDVLKYEFITVVTHKFRTPLTRIKWASEMLKKLIPRESADESRLAVEEIDTANELMVELTDMLIGLKHSDDIDYLYSFEEADLCKVVEKAVKNMSHHIQDKNLEFSFSCAPDIPLAMLDMRRMQFALQIVIENAIIYTPAGGKVSVSVRQDGGRIAVEVRDSGIGISKDDLDRMFTKFFRSKEAKTTDTEGMGIGLFMAHQIVERHDGDIRVTSSGVGQGSTFVVELPKA